MLQACEATATMILTPQKVAIKKKITKLMAAGFIREILHPDWLASLVLV
jgi:hypothetical protein